MVQLLIENGANPNTSTKEEFGKLTPLHLAVNFKFKKIQDLLLDAGADEKAVNSKGELPWETITGSEGI
jgi:ankyrin repeat protein